MTSRNELFDALTYLHLCNYCLFAEGKCPQIDMAIEKRKPCSEFSLSTDVDTIIVIAKLMK
jgi:hypothetical protein